jgi:hypothetical protein
VWKNPEVSDVFAVPGSYFASCQCPYWHITVHLERGLNEAESRLVADRITTDPEVQIARIDLVVIPNLCADDPDVDLDDPAQRSGCEPYSLSAGDISLPSDATQVGANQEYRVYHRHR